MSENLIYLYIIFMIFFLFSFSFVKNLYKFFFFSEMLWMMLFLILSFVELISNSNIIFVNVLFILIFTAFEALIIGCIFLLHNKNFFLKI